MEINSESIIKMIDRSCQVLEYLYNTDGAASISKIAVDLDLPKANVFRILYTLSTHGLVEQEIKSDLYRLGKNMIKYGEKVSDDLDIVKRAKPYMKKLAMDREEYEYGLSCIAVPIRHSNGEIYTMLSVSGPTTRLEYKGMDRVEDELKQIAKQVEIELV